MDRNDYIVYSDGYGYQEIPGFISGSLEYASYPNEAKTSSLTLAQRFARFVILLLVKLSKGGDMMMAMFFAQRVILGKTTFDKVPKALKKGVAEVLIDSGLPELVPSEFGGTADLPAA